MELPSTELSSPDKLRGNLGDTSSSLKAVGGMLICGLLVRDQDFAEPSEVVGDSGACAKGVVARQDLVALGIGKGSCGLKFCGSSVDCDSTVAILFVDGTNVRACS